VRALLNKAGIKNITKEPVLHDENFSSQVIPDGWIWQDIGNYFGAGSLVTELA
jgi:D-alanyl-D-alanine carboxypeptidase/D-alanyl-D-alanine-endopeptidase (penicillin-binding protein 4)